MWRLLKKRIRQETDRSHGPSDDPHREPLLKRGHQIARRVSSTLLLSLSNTVTTYALHLLRPCQRGRYKLLALVFVELPEFHPTFQSHHADRHGCASKGQHRHPTEPVFLIDRACIPP